MTIPNVLLLSEMTPGFPGVGGVFLRDLCLSYPEGHLCCFSVLHATAPTLSPPPELATLPYAWAREPRQRFPRVLGTRVSRWGGLAVRLYSWFVTTHQLVDRIAAFSRQHSVDTIWVTLSTPMMVILARKVAQALNAKLLPLIWDPSDEKIEIFDPISNHLLRHEYRAILHASTRCGVASANMADEYQRLYNIEPVILIHSVSKKQRKLPSLTLKSQTELLIGFAGLLYAEQEWFALLRALASVKWQIAGRDITIRVMGKRLPLPSTPLPSRIEYLGWQSLDDTLELVSQCDVAYLPYWFDNQHRSSTRLCFPNKLATYLASGQPVLYHGPEDASPVRFLQQFPAGLCCHSLEPQPILRALEQFITQPDLYSQAVRAGQNALEKELSEAVFLGRFAQLIGIDESLLQRTGNKVASV